MINTVRMIRWGDVLRPLFLLRLIAALVLMFPVSAAPPAHAQLLFTLDQPLRTALPGETLLFSGSLTNIGPQELFLNADTFNLTGTNLTLDDSPFLTNFPLSLASGGVASGQMFSVAIGSNATGGVYPGSFTIIGGSTDSSFNSLATQNFQVSIAAPEPASGGLLLIFLGAILTKVRLGAGFRRHVQTFRRYVLLIVPSRWLTARIAAFLLGAVASGIAASSAHAEIILVPANDFTYGLMAEQTHTVVSGSIMTNPLFLTVGDVQASYSNNGTQVQFTYLLNRNPHLKFAGMGLGPLGNPGTITNEGAIKFTIVGTNGEAIGTNVDITVHSTLISDTTSKEVSYTNRLDNYDVPLDFSYYSPYKVGDSFSYWAAVFADIGHGARFDSTLVLTVPGLGGSSSAAPEPGTLALLSMNAMPLLLVLRKRRSRSHCQSGH